MRNRNTATLYRLTIAIVLNLAMPFRAAADPPKIDVAAGYSFLYLHDFDYGNGNYPLGWFLSVGGQVSRVFEVAGEISGNRRNTTFLPGAVVSELHTNIYSFMGGLKIAKPRGRLRPYAQILVGVVRIRPSVAIFSRTDFAIGPGGGVDVAVSGRTGVRLGANFRAMHTEDSARTSRPWSKQFQILAGIVFHTAK